ncbi:MAG: hypothetical protein JXQ71_14775 [Verrucomicrobia bacterium]|nr:hypothetical protein [Verrucomicrobiota bacterium]
MVGWLLVAVCVVVAQPVCADGPPPLPVFNWFLFNDTNVVDAYGSPPITTSNIFLVESWESNAVEIASSEPAALRYLEIQTNGYPNIWCEEGTIYFWFQPYWSSTNAGGTGPST